MGSDAQLAGGADISRSKAKLHLRYSSGLYSVTFNFNEN